MNPHTLDSVLPELLPVPRLVTGPLERLVGLPQVRELYNDLQARGDGHSMPERLLTSLEVTCRVSDRDLERLPRKGPVILVANHPFGILEGAVLATLLARIRPDAKFLANRILMAVPEIRHLLIPVDPFVRPKTTQSNREGLRRALEHLRSGGLLVVFPAGEVSHFRWVDRTVTDPPWNPVVARIVTAVSRSGAAVRVAPCFISGANSVLFQVLGMLHPRLRTVWLGRELLNKRRSAIDIRIGSPIEAAKLLDVPTDEERTKYLRWRTYLLARRAEYKPMTSLPLLRRRNRGLARTPLAEAVPAALLAAEIGSLGPSHLMLASGELEVYLTTAEEIPGVLAEIGRLRELSFRGAGEGTGKASDLDEFDRHYLHLFVWNKEKLEVVAAYRLAAVDVVCGEHGVKGLYTATLFRYGQEFLARLGPALELGRSFVRPEYQRAFTPLLLLWKGIGRYVARNPKYKVLFGPVSINNLYQPISRQLMVSFLERHAWLSDLAGLVTTRNPFRARPEGAWPRSDTRCDIEDLAAAIADIEPAQAGVPVLLRQYLKLGGKLLGFNVDRKFSDAIDGLIVVDLTKTEPKLVERYLGRAEAAKFFAYQKGAYATE